MYLIGIVRMNAEGKGEVLAKVGEDTFHRELEKKMLAKKMKEVKKEMVQAVFANDENWGVKIPTNLVSLQDCSGPHHVCAPSASLLAAPTEREPPFSSER